jgi:hypothetical protein
MDKEVRILHSCSCLRPLTLPPPSMLIYCRVFVLVEHADSECYSLSTAVVAIAAVSIAFILMVFGGCAWIAWNPLSRPFLDRVSYRLLLYALIVKYVLYTIRLWDTPDCLQPSLRSRHCQRCENESWLYMLWRYIFLQCAFNYFLHPPGVAELICVIYVQSCLIFAATMFFSIALNLPYVTIAVDASIQVVIQA